MVQFSYRLEAYRLHNKSECVKSDDRLFLQHSSANVQTARELLQQNKCASFSVRVSERETDRSAVYLACATSIGLIVWGAERWAF